MADTLKRQFQAVMKTLTHSAPEPRPQTRRRRREETGRAFRFAAKKILRPVTRIPVIAHAAAFLWDTLDWLNPWQGCDAVNTNEADEGFHYTEQNHISPHP